MGQDQITQLLQQGIAAARGNRPDIARGIFQQVVTMDARNETAWAWLASIARNNKERLIFLKRLWEINPQNEFALKGLHALGIDPSREQQSAGQPTTVPLLDDARFSRTQQAVDDFLRRYTPEPVDHLRIKWEPRTRRRYGEEGAQRLRRVVYAAAALAVFLFVSIIVFVLMQVDVLGSGSDSASISTLFPTQTPIATLTPTLGGPTPTDFPEMVFEATSIPAGLPPGNVLMISSPTPISPAPNPSVDRSLKAALAFYAIGEYDTANDMLVDLHESNEPHCYPSLVYFEALSYAQLGEFDRAENLLEWGQTYEPPDRLMNSCQDSPLMTAGLAEISYWEGAYTRALELSVQALDQDDELVPALLTKGRSELALGQLTEAWQTVTRGLDRNPDDTNLLLLAAETELANDAALAALDYVGQALYLDPDLQPGLYLQTEAYLMLGDQSTATDRQMQAYGLAVRSAQLLLQYYPGDPVGYLYLAKARLGEGNPDLAETSLTRIAELEDVLPDSAALVVQDVFRTRGEMYFSQGRFDEALADLEHYLSFTDEFDAPAVEMIVASARKLDNGRKVRDWVAVLLNAEPENPTYNLMQAEVWVELCALYDNVTCEYDDALDLLDDGFVASLPLNEQRADAYSYRAQARYHTVERQSAVLSDEQRETALRDALDDTTQALAVREAVIDHYYRGLLFEALENPARAYEEYQWVSYWNATYAYSFLASDFEDRFAAVSRTVEAEQSELVLVVDEPESRPSPAQDEEDETPAVTDVPDDEPPATVVSDEPDDVSVPVDDDIPDIP